MSLNFVFQKVNAAVRKIMQKERRKLGRQTYSGGVPFQPVSLNIHPYGPPAMAGPPTMAVLPAMQYGPAMSYGPSIAYPSICGYPSLYGYPGQRYY
jgi:hypothetical protein